MDKTGTLLNRLEKLKTGQRAEFCSSAWRDECMVNPFNMSVYLRIMKGEGKWLVKCDTERGVYIFTRKPDMIHTGR